MERIFIATALFLGTASAHGAVLVDPVTFTGADAIDPAGAEELDFLATGAVASDILESRPDFLAVHDFAGFGGGVGSSNYFSFTDGSLPDVRFTTAVNSSAAGYSTGTSALNSSPGTSVYLGNGTMRYEIDFGSYDAVTSTFDASVNSVSAAGFALIRQADPASGARTFTVEFRSDEGALLSTQTYTDQLGGESGDDVFFGYQALAGESIGRITLRLASDGNTLGGNTALDDFGFTTVPEPASMTLMLGGLVAVGCRRRFA